MHGKNQDAGRHRFIAERRLIAEVFGRFIGRSVFRIGVLPGGIAMLGVGRGEPRIRIGRCRRMSGCAGVLGVLFEAIVRNPGKNLQGKQKYQKENKKTAHRKGGKEGGADYSKYPARRGIADGRPRRTPK
jgi:hypothetical protein